MPKNVLVVKQVSDKAESDMKVLEREMPEGYEVEEVKTEECDHSFLEGKVGTGGVVVWCKVCGEQKSVKFNEIFEEE